MKCPVCGQWNRASLPRCQKCGAELNPDETALPSWKATLRDDQKGKEYISVDEDGDAIATPDQRDALAREMAELKQRKSAGIRQQRILRQESAQRGSAPSGMTIRTHSSEDSFWKINDNPRTTVRIKRDGAAEEPQQPRRRATRHVQADNIWQDSRTYDPLWEEQELSGTWQLPQNTQFTTRLPSRTRGLRHIIRFLLAVIMTGILALCIFFGWNYFKDRQQSAREAHSASVTASIKDDMAAHTILIPGEEGAQIYIRELRASYIVAGGFATVDVLDHIWYDDVTDFVGDTMEVTLTPFVKTASGQQKPLEPIVYDISIPLSPITMLTPDGPRTEVSTAMYSMEFVVRPGSEVYINDKNVSDTVNEKDGRFTYNATVQPIGDNNFVVRVRSQYCRENKMTITLYRERQEIPLDLAADTISSTSKEHIDIHATTMPGALVDVLSPHSDLNITEIDATGAFTFEALFDHIGYNTISITASYPGKKTSVVEYKVYYVPTADIYTPKAWPLNRQDEYSELLGNLTYRADHTQIYEVKGKIAYFVSEKPQMAVIFTGEDGESRPVLLENFTRTTWKEGESYRIYGDVYSSYNNMPWLAARYTYPMK